MKKTSIFLIVLSSIFGLGVILTLTGLALGGKIYSFSIGNRVTNSPGKSVSHTLPDISLTDTTDIQSLDFDLTANDIEIKTGTKYSISGGRLSENTVENGVWTIKSYYSDYFYEIDIFGLDLPIPRFWRKNENFEKITVTLPEGIDLQDVTIDAGAAKLNIDFLGCNTIGLEVSAGDANIQSLSAETADISVDVGKLNIEQYQITGSADIECSVGDLNLGSKRYANDNLCSSLNVECALGNVDIYGKLMKNSSIDCSMGDIELNLAGISANYFIEKTSQSLGDINFSGYYNSKQQQSADEVYGVLELSCSMGDININYLGD
ncbi:MAG: DUF4097 domain-containing protein [Lachnospiraceae bacterium]|nr:DUF4097 domain-containing protein [Lachnospiraceae bacterium]